MCEGCACVQNGPVCPGLDSRQHSAATSYTEHASKSGCPQLPHTCLKKCAVSMFTPMAANTMAKGSLSPSSSPCFTRPACRQICAAMSLCGRPAAEKSGIFCPRAMEFMTSMVEMPARGGEGGEAGRARVGGSMRGVNLQAFACLLPGTCNASSGAS